ncbi:hypothetical protein BKI52_26260 [marine bacterium AO1-C]|nr:hypothetical protein BKI52_26260 [marine bacterium AO1-C]
MEKLLSETFYNNLKEVLSNNFETNQHKVILEKVDWEAEAQKVLTDLTVFFSTINTAKLKDFEIDEIGVIDLCWNEYGGDIEVDFMPDNNFDTAFDEGCIMNNSAVDNDKFFETHFDVNGEGSWAKIGDDYHQIISLYYHLINEIIGVVTQQEEFQNLPKKSPCHIGFAFFHDEERTKIFSVD